MRITGGKAHSVPLQTGKGADLRPATDRMREAVFSSLGDCVEGVEVLDLFAGTGAYGLEALSRGARRVDLVERDARLAEVLRSNLAAVCKSAGRELADVSLYRADAFKWAPPTGRLYTLLLADPPYRLLPKALPDLFRLAGQWLVPGSDARLLIELPGDMTCAASGWKQLRRLGKGKDAPSVAIFGRDLG